MSPESLRRTDERRLIPTQSAYFVHSRKCNRVHDVSAIPRGQVHHSADCGYRDVKCIDLCLLRYCGFADEAISQATCFWRNFEQCHVLQVCETFVCQLAVAFRHFIDDNTRCEQLEVVPSSRPPLTCKFLI